MAGHKGPAFYLLKPLRSHLEWKEWDISMCSTVGTKLNWDGSLPNFAIVTDSINSTEAVMRNN